MNNLLTFLFIVGELAFLVYAIGYPLSLSFCMIE